MGGTLLAPACFIDNQTGRNLLGGCCRLNKSVCGWELCTLPETANSELLSQTGFSDCVYAHVRSPLLWPGGDQKWRLSRAPKIAHKLHVNSPYKNISKALTLRNSVLSLWTEIKSISVEIGGAGRRKAGPRVSGKVFQREKQTDSGCFADSSSACVWALC